MPSPLGFHQKGTLSTFSHPPGSPGGLRRGKEIMGTHDEGHMKDITYHLLGGFWLGGGHQRIPAVIIDGVTLHHSKDRNLDRDVGMLGSLAGESLGTSPRGCCDWVEDSRGRRKQRAQRAVFTVQA